MSDFVKFIKGDSVKVTHAEFTDELLSKGWEVAREAEEAKAEPKPKAKKGE